MVSDRPSRNNSSPALQLAHGVVPDLDALRERSVLFASLSDEDIVALMQPARLVSYDARQVVFQASDPGDHLHIVVEGKVKVSLISPEGKEAILSFLGPGEMFGEMSLLDGEPRSATVTVVEDCRLLTLARKDFLAFLAAHPPVSFKLLCALSMRLRATNEQVGGLSFLNLPARLARVLLNLGQQYGRISPDGIVIGLKLSQEDLGNLVGVSRESVNRQIRLWSDAEYLDHSHGTVVLKNSEALFRESLNLGHI